MPKLHFFVLWIWMTIRLYFLIMVLSIKQTSLHFPKMSSRERIDEYANNHTHWRAAPKNIKASIWTRLGKWQFKIDDSWQKISPWVCEIKQSSSEPISFQENYRLNLNNVILFAYFRTQYLLHISHQTWCIVQYMAKYETKIGSGILVHFNRNLMLFT